MNDKTVMIAVGLAAIVAVLFLSSQQPVQAALQPETVTKQGEVSDAVVEVDVEEEP